VEYVPRQRVDTDGTRVTIDRPNDTESADERNGAALARAFARRGDQLAEVRLALVDALQELHTENDQLKARVSGLALQNEKFHDALLAANHQNELLEQRIAATFSSRVMAKVREFRRRS